MDESDTQSFSRINGICIQELLNFHLDSRANWKISKRRFFGDFLNSFNWVTQIGPKMTQKIFFENISKTTGATVVQNFGILDGAADLRVEIWPKFFCQFSAVMWWTFAENFNEISQTVFEQSSIYWKILDSIRLSSVDPPTFSKNWLNLGGWHPEFFSKLMIVQEPFEISHWNFQQMIITCLR